ncbi:MAG: DNA-directed RNA polymerase subunit B [Candidatus Aenigmatarchaeota archaeon]
MTDVFLNGKFVGETEEPKELVREVREKRREGALPEEFNARYNRDEENIRINTDSGRVRRPLVRVEDGESLLTEEHIEKVEEGEMSWSDLVEEGIIEWIDASEEEDLLVAPRKEELTDKHTHIEIHPANILGINASLVPFPEYNRGDRISYGAKMIGQTLGFYSANYPLRADTKSNILSYPQTPLVTTQTEEAVELEKHPTGQNVVVALISYKGFNIEDALIVNKSSVERGFARSYFFRTYDAEKQRYSGGQEDEIGIPDKDVRGYRSEDAYSDLSEDGIVPPEVDIESGDVLVGKTSPLRFMGTGEFVTGMQNRRETSVTVRHGEGGVADKVLLSETEDGNKLVKVTLREKRVPELGDKFATRHGQKGVIGLMEPEENLPFTKDGVTPDVILNPHGIPSRQTVGQLLEVLGGKVGALSGKKVDATPFTGEEEEDLRERLRDLGFRSDGKEVLYNGTTGEMVEAEIFQGIVYYEKLEHMVSNKIHARSRGPVTLLTKQPTEGRAKEGGLRLGEMEKDCFIGHGASMTLKERFSSDEVTLPICKECGVIAVEDESKGEVRCPMCEKSEDVEEVEMSYAFKLLLDELKSMTIYPKLNIEESV